MWIIELNVAGYHFSREIPDLKRRPFRFSPRNLHWPAPRPLQRCMTPAKAGTEVPRRHRRARRTKARRHPNKMLVSAAEVMRERGAAG